MNKKRIIGIVLLFVFVWTGSRATEQVVRYPSVDQFGGPLVLSGRLTIPQNNSSRGMMLLLHGTNTGNHEVPSNKPMYEEQWFGKDYVLVMPDYMGYGATRDSLHPYLCGALTARHCVDMLIAVRSILDSQQVKMQTDSITIVGYSQGGAAALWTYRLLEEKYASSLPVKACYAGSGPYDVASEFDLCVARNKTGMPITVPMLVLGTDMAYNLHLDPDDYFTCATKQAVKRFIRKKEIGFVNVWFQTPVHQLSYWLTKKGRDKSQPATQRIYEGLLRSSLVHYPIDKHPVGQDSICPSWRPKAATFIFHSTNDDIVGFQSSEHLHRCWGEQENIHYEFGKYGGHMQSYQLFMKRVCEELGI